MKRSKMYRSSKIGENRVYNGGVSPSRTFYIDYKNKE